ncbi:INO80 complex subunit E [Armadillidium vulgare]|nr:INO80 complex subunit E [Armadillidium vulgare]
MATYQEADYKALYKNLKRKLKVLIYENECFQDELKKSQRSLLKVQRDKTFLLDRILQYQQGPESSSDSEQTDESDNENYNKDNKRKKVSQDQNSSFNLNVQNGIKNSNIKKKKNVQNVLGGGIVTSKNSSHRQGGKQISSTVLGSQQLLNRASSFPSTSSHHKHRSLSLHANLTSASSGATLSSTTQSAAAAAAAATSDGQMTREEIERQLAARQPFSDFSTAVSLTLPNQLFSDNVTEGELLENELETSPSNVGEDITFENFE